MAEPAMIQIEDLTKTYVMGEETVTALDGVSLSIARGESIAIIGPSGSGKSTLMNILGGLDRPSRGRYRFEGDEVARFSDDQLADFRNRRIGFVFQSFQLLPRLSALQNVELPMVYAGAAPRARRERAAELLERVGLGSRMGHRPNQLSGGQQQRVAIARSLANQPDLLLADEPTGALDSATGVEVLGLFQKLNTEGLTVVLVTHDRGVADAARRRIAFRDGRVTEDVRS
ncbi:MAG: ABC transporter ATP-binding protein [Phenylobacterium sp.]|jgi:putative ABC transport system ATP-binding protein|uniref:ABC transporter ATP-binding protein n=1 Tax=Phenylobacterium sp. TaxID=1871053 RepID=UPI0025CBC9B2|nr:ABC transporter ATP-binding protein [Phenylobacterium sp.]MCA3713366.1 ABC transporter ATP-binding protein [Phenylobacterium sp.]MCA3715747.1 ABC transporter ATP-binding protein [Phenylobacterium sp.]MCA3725017.1 ABC transporter ATP-binding protein [Phenylobacterium sp.]MCA3725932.1 ABC transporter ATP-binding protein [Phenylobacterium sp.]MCA3732129.1 ABC transporter ATP-binding protein [Phenylobacterium sp.]